MKIRKLLLATDLSEESERPYATVAALARDVGASITLLNVVEDLVVAAHGAPMAPPIHPIDNAQQIERARRLLEENAEELRHGVDVTCEVIEGLPVSNAIAKYASDNDFDLLAITTHGRTGVRRIVLGSVAESVLRHARVPVLCFSRDASDRGSDPTDVKHILLTTDLSGEALRPFHPVLDLAKSLGCRVTVLHVVPEIRTIPHGTPGFRTTRMEREIAMARTSVEEQCSSLGDGVDLDIQVISADSVAKGIVEFAGENEVDLIALSTHGRTGFRRLALGSVAEEVLRRSPVPVLSFQRTADRVVPADV